MPLIPLSPGWMILLCFLLWPVFQLVPVAVCLAMPDRLFRPTRFPYHPFRWESGGRIYRRYLKVERWKQFLPDGGALFRKGVRKRHLDCRDPEELERFLIESCRGELTHWLAMMPVGVFALFTPVGVFLLMILYALVINMPCIIAQRYNRPRIASHLDTILR
jgi:glycosyl-4,4'-diaponeurosporenoate acyltransferase